MSFREGLFVFLTTGVCLQCVQDLYVADINLISETTFSTKWDVTGPSKGYTIFSNYDRAAVMDDE